jgi:hypothetical protein
MAFHIKWANDDQTVLIVAPPPGWHWATSTVALHMVNDHINSSRGVVPVIVDLRGADSIPEGSIVHLRNLLAGAHKRTGPIIALTRPGSEVVPLLKNLMDIVANVYKLRWTVLYTSDPDEAYELALANVTGSNYSDTQPMERLDLQ